MKRIVYSLLALPLLLACQSNTLDTVQESKPEKRTIVETGELSAVSTKAFVLPRFGRFGSFRIIGLAEHAPSVEVAYVDPENSYFTSHAGVVYEKKSTSPLYIPAAMHLIELIPAETYGKETLKGHEGVWEVIFPAGTKKIEAWAVENCPNLLAAYIPVGTEVDEKAFTGCHTDFQIIWEDQTGIKDIIAD